MNMIPLINVSVSFLWALFNPSIIDNILLIQLQALMASLTSGATILDGTPWKIPLLDLTPSFSQVENMMSWISLWYPEPYGWIRHWFFDLDFSITSSAKLASIFSASPLSSSSISSLIVSWTEYNCGRQYARDSRTMSCVRKSRTPLETSQ